MYTNIVNDFALKWSHEPLLLKPGEAEMLVESWRTNGDANARERVVRSYMRLVVSIARKATRSRPEHLEDAISEGTLGLLRAIEKFDASRGTFYVCVRLWIRAFVLRYVQRVRIVPSVGTREHRRIFSQLPEARLELTRLGKEGTLAELAEHLDALPEDVDVVLASAYTARELSLDEPVGYETEAVPMLRRDVIANNEPSPEQRVVWGHFAARLEVAVRAFCVTLTPRDRVIVEERILSEDPATLDAIGERYGVTRERIRQRDAVLRPKLAEHLRRWRIDKDRKELAA